MTKGTRYHAAALAGQRLHLVEFARRLERQRDALLEALRDCLGILEAEFPGASVDGYWPTVAPTIAMARAAIALVEKDKP